MSPGLIKVEACAETYISDTINCFSVIAKVSLSARAKGKADAGYSYFNQTLTVHGKLFVGIYSRTHNWAWLLLDGLCRAFMLC